MPAYVTGKCLARRAASVTFFLLVATCCSVVLAVEPTVTAGRPNVRQRLRTLSHPLPDSFVVRTERSASKTTDQMRTAKERSSTVSSSSPQIAVPLNASHGTAAVAEPDKPTWCRRWRDCFANWAKQRVKIEYGLKLPAFDGHAANEPLVVFIHGLNSRPEDLAVLIADAEHAGMLCAAFRYPNDQPLADSAQLLSVELSKVRTRHPRRPVYLVTHSMGGLVARAVIEDGELDPRNVRRLVMIAPPNQGSRLARFALSMDLYEYARSAERRREAGPIAGAFADGLAEATRDLQPDSDFLVKLNERGRNPRVTYSLLIGTESFVARERVDHTQQWLDRAGERCRWLAKASDSFTKHVVPLEELIDCEGDGCVAVRRAQLPDVDDVEIGRFSHNGLLMNHDNDECQRCRSWVLARLNQQAATGSRVANF